MIILREPGEGEEGREWREGHEDAGDGETAVVGEVDFEYVVSEDECDGLG